MTTKTTTRYIVRWEERRMTPPGGEGGHTGVQQREEEFSTRRDARKRCNLLLQSAALGVRITEAPDGRRGRL